MKKKNDSFTAAGLLLVLVSGCVSHPDGQPFPSEEDASAIHARAESDDHLHQDDDSAENGHHGLIERQDSHALPPENGDQTRKFERMSFRACAQDVNRNSVLDLDTYHTVRLPSVAMDWVPEESIIVDPAFLGDKTCQREFEDLMKKDLQRALAMWIFSLTNREGPLGHPQELIFSSPSRTGDYLIDGGKNRGILHVSSPSWPISMVVKVAEDACEAQAIGKRMTLTPIAGKKSVEQDVTAPEMSFGRWGPHFAVPLAMGTYAAHHTVRRGSDGAVVLMRRATGVTSERNSSFTNPHFERSLAGAYLEGAALAAFQGADLRPLEALENPQDFTRQTIWCHGDLHYGNVLVEHEKARVHYLDFERMCRCDNWFELEVQGSVPLPGPADAATSAWVGEMRVTPGHCLAQSESWLAEPSVRTYLGQRDPYWLASRLRLVAFARGYLSATPHFAREPMALAFERLCRRGMGFDSW